MKLLNSALYLVKKKLVAVLCNKSKKEKIIQIQTTICFLTGGEERAVIWASYFIVAVGRKLLWILFREIRHANLKLQTVHYPWCITGARRVCSAQSPKHCKGKQN